jgi:ferredoxin
MPDITTMITLLGGIESAELTVHQERCTKVRNRNSSCQRCVDACTSGALSFDEGELVVSAELCVGCGTCATVCPTEALEARNPADVEFLHSCTAVFDAGQREIVVACSPLLDAERDGYDRSLVVEVRCLGRVDETVLATLTAMGSDKIICAHASCASCSNSRGEQTYLLVQKTYRALMQAWDYQDMMQITAGLPKHVKLSKRLARKTNDVDGISRREFFTQVRLGAKARMASTLEKVIPAEGLAVSSPGQHTPSKPAVHVTRVMRDGTLPHFIPNRRERLLEQLNRLGSPTADYLDTRLWGHMSFDRELCSSCRMCATFCPTGAIDKFDDEDGTIGIEHYPADCVQCRLCQDICPTGAARLQSKVPIRELVEGIVERHEMDAPLRGLSSPHSIITSIKQLFNDSNINDRP